MSKKKYKINYARLATSIIIFLTILLMIAEGFPKLFKKDNKPAPCVHEYSDGVCIKCSEKDPDYVAPPADPRLSWPDTVTSESAYPLSSSDEDYLVLVNKKLHVTQSYVPNDLVVVSRNVEGVGSPAEGTTSLRKVAADALNAMFDAAESEGIYLKLRTGYRSYDYQRRLFNSYASNHGEAEANKYSAKPGESEHQTGLAADLGGKSQGYVLSDYFGDTPEGKWVKENCYKYGFILRFIDGTLDTVGQYTGYIYEAWHVRYVGLEAAKIITENNWTLEQYLDQIKDAKK